MAKALTSGETEECFKAAMSMIGKVATASTCGLMEELIMVNGRMVSSMEKATTWCQAVTRTN